MRELVRTISARDTSGNRHTIHEYQEYRDVSSHSGRGRIPTLKDLRTSAGEPVQRIGNGSYLVVSSNQLLTEAPSTGPR